jgi:exportin-T
VVDLINGLRDLLPIVVDLPELDNPEQDLVSEAIANPGLFDGQLYVYETVGILISILYRAPEQEHALLRSVVQPLMEDLNANLEAIRQSAGEAVPVIRAHHNVVALGNIVKGFPDYPSPVPSGYLMPPLQLFDEISRAIIISLEAMNAFRALRDAVSWVVFFIIKFN